MSIHNPLPPLHAKAGTREHDTLALRLTAILCSIKILIASSLCLYVIFEKCILACNSLRAMEARLVKIKSGGHGMEPVALATIFEIVIN